MSLHSEILFSVPSGRNYHIDSKSRQIPDVISYCCSRLFLGNCFRYPHNTIFLNPMSESNTEDTSIWCMWKQHNILLP